MTSTLTRLYQGTPAQLSAPTLSTIATATTGGTLAAQQWNYAVTTVDSSGNETTASPELYITTTGSTSTVTVTWVAATGASQYKVYRRSPVTGAPLGLIATVSSATLTYTDTNATATTSPPSVNGTGETALYTVPSGATTTVTQVVIANNNLQAVTAAVSIVPSGNSAGAANRVVPQLTQVRANDMRVFDLKQVMTAGDKLSGITSTTGVVITISGLVQS